MDSSKRNTGNRLLDYLSGADFKSLEPHAVRVLLEQNAILCEPGGHVEFALFPISAVLSVIAIMQDGQGVEACTIGHESAYGLLHGLGATLATERVIAQISGEALRIPISRLKAAAAHSPSLTDVIVRHVQANVVQIQQSVACNAIHHVEARLCRWLLMSQDRTDNDKLPLTQEFLGFMLGVSRTTVTGAARALQSAGLIRYVRGRIEILDRAGLEEGACECYAAVQENYHQIVGARSA